MSSKDPVALVCSDIHLSLTPPPARAGESDWFTAMDRPLRQMRKWAKQYDVPVICAGDIFDRWNPTSELINFALEALPRRMIAIPGQHDLPYHNLGDWQRSGFGVLVRAGHLVYLTPDEAHQLNGIWVWGFPWGVPIVPRHPRRDDNIQVAVVHAYIWQKGKGYPGAREDQRITAYADQLKGYDVAVFGDNHKGFTGWAGHTLVHNNGGLMRRKSDEVDYHPRCGLLYRNGEMESLHFNLKEEVFAADTKTVIKEHDDEAMRKFLDDIGGLEKSSLDFKDALRQWLQAHQGKTSAGVQSLILKALDEHD